MFLYYRYQEVNMSLVDEIRTTQAETIVKYEEKLRMDKDIVLKVFNEMIEQIRRHVSEYTRAKDANHEQFDFVLKDRFNQDKYSIILDKEYVITVKEYQAILNSFLNDGFKISQVDCEERVMYHRLDQNMPHIEIVRKLNVEW